MAIPRFPVPTIYPPGYGDNRYAGLMRFPDEVTEDVHKRLRRVEGQIRGIQRLVEEGADCSDVVTQLAAAQAALSKVGFRLVSAGMQYCAQDPAKAAREGMSHDELEKLFLRLG